MPDEREENHNFWEVQGRQREAGNPQPDAGGRTNIIVQKTREEFDEAGIHVEKTGVNFGLQHKTDLAFLTGSRTYLVDLKPESVREISLWQGRKLVLRRPAKREVPAELKRIADELGVSPWILDDESIVGGRVSWGSDLNFVLGLQYSSSAMVSTLSGVTLGAGEITKEKKQELPLGQGATLIYPEKKRAMQIVNLGRIFVGGGEVEIGIFGAEQREESLRVSLGLKLALGERSLTLLSRVKDRPDALMSMEAGKGIGLLIDMDLLNIMLGYSLVKAGVSGAVFSGGFVLGARIGGDPNKLSDLAVQLEDGKDVRVSGGVFFENRAVSIHLPSANLGAGLKFGPEGELRGALFLLQLKPLSIQYETTYQLIDLSYRAKKGDLPKLASLSMPGIPGISSVSTVLVEAR